MATAFYTIVQYCPDRRRSEAVNVGLILLRPEPYVLLVGMTDPQARVCKLFAPTELQIVNLKIAMQGLQNRINGIRTVEDLTEFAASRANDLQLTEPRLIIIDDIDADFERLYFSIVEPIQHWRNLLSYSRRWNYP